MTQLERLLSIASPPLGRQLDKAPIIIKEVGPGAELLEILWQKNGFYAFESSLHVFPVTNVPESEISLEAWNASELWRYSYGDLAQGLLFFAEDLFQDQFCLGEKGVYRFKAETGERVLLGASLEEWADKILSDHRSETGWPIAHEWQATNGSLPPGKRLMPKTPFFLGGEYSLDNLWLGDAIEGMRFKGDLALQTKDLPEGTPIKLHIAGRPGS